MYTALTQEKQIGGLLALSSWLPLYKTFPQALKWNSSTPVLHCHGKYIGCSHLKSLLCREFLSPTLR